MAMMQAEISGPWGDDNGELNPQVCIDYCKPENAPYSLEDITNQDAANIPPEVNLVNVIFTADESVIAAIDADPKYLVLWSELV